MVYGVVMWRGEDNKFYLPIQLVEMKPMSDRGIHKWKGLKMRLRIYRWTFHAQPSMTVPIEQMQTYQGIADYVYKYGGEGIWCVSCKYRRPYHRSAYPKHLIRIELIKKTDGFVYRVIKDSFIRRQKWFIG